LATTAAAPPSQPRPHGRDAINRLAGTRPGR
jgi:hypothetical protein